MSQAIINTLKEFNPSPFYQKLWMKFHLRYCLDGWKSCRQLKDSRPEEFCKRRESLPLQWVGTTNLLTVANLWLLMLSNYYECVKQGVHFSILWFQPPMLCHYRTCSDVGVGRRHYSVQCGTRHSPHPEKMDAPTTRVLQKSKDCNQNLLDKIPFF